MSTLPLAALPVARMTQAQIDQLFVDTKYICDALSMFPTSVNGLMTRQGKQCVRLAGKIAWYRQDADEVIAKVKAEREANVSAGRPVAWK